MRRLFARLKPPLRMRTWMIAGIVGLVSIPWIGAIAVIGTIQLFEPSPSLGFTTPPPSRLFDPRAAEALYAAVESQPHRWGDPEWRKQVEQQLIQRNLRVFLQNSTGTLTVEIPDPWGTQGAPAVGSLLESGRPAREMLIYTDSRLAGKAIWFDTWEDPDTAGVKRQGSSDEVQAVFREVESQSDKWLDPQWRAEMAKKLAPLQLQVSLRDNESNLYVDIPATNPAEWPEVGLPPFTIRKIGPVMIPERETAVYRDGRSAGVARWNRVIPADLASHHFNAVLDAVLPPTIVGLILFTIWLAIHLAHRAVLRPLSVLSVASRQIKEGDLEFTVPSSPITEVNEFARAYEQMRQGLKESITQQATMEQQRRMFIAALAHDLRTPLTSVRGYLEGLRDGVARTPDKVEKYVAVALEKTESLERLIESLFAFAKTEYLEQLPQRERLELGGLLHTAAEAMLPRARTKQVSIRVDGSLEPCWLEGDRLMLSRVVDNLLDNAIRHTPANGSVTVGWNPGPDQATFWIHDSGPGIPAEDRPHIFDPLYRGDKARGTRTGGAGLGLAIAKRLIEAHGGSISATNEGGARFTINLPR